MKIFDCLSVATRVALFVSFVPKATEPVVVPQTKGVVVVVNAIKGGRGPVVTQVTAAMQREAFKKGGFYRTTVSGKVEFVVSAAISARIAARKAAQALALVENLLVEVFCPENKQAQLARKEARGGVSPTKFDKNGIRFI